MRDLDIIVAGGGIGGLTAAIALLRAGNRVTVFEAARDFGEVGAGVTLAPNAMLGYQALELGAAIEEKGISPHRQVVRHWQDGRVLKTLDRGDGMREEIRRALSLHSSCGPAHNPAQCFERTGRQDMHCQPGRVRWV